MRKDRRLTKPQALELVRRHNLSVKLPPTKIAPPVAGQRIVCQRLRKLKILDKNNDLTTAGFQRALELGGDQPENAEEWLGEQAMRLQRVEKRRGDKVSALALSLAPVEDGGGCDLHDGDEEAFYNQLDAVVAQLKS